MKKLILILALALAIPTASWADAYVDFESGPCDNGHIWWCVTTYNDHGVPTGYTYQDCDGSVSTVNYGTDPQGNRDSTITLNGSAPNTTSTTFTPLTKASWSVTDFNLGVAICTVSCDTGGNVTVGPPPSMANPGRHPTPRVTNEELSGVSSAISTFRVANTVAGLKISIVANNPTHANFEVFDDLGRLVYASNQSNLVAGNNELPLLLPPSLHDGNYFVRVTTDGATLTRKIQIHN